MSLDLPPKKPRGGCLRIFIGLLLVLPALNALVFFVPMWTTGFPVGIPEDERLFLQLFLGTTVLVFGGGAIALIVSGARAIGRRRALQTQIEAAHPREPWLWRPDWASGRIVSGGPPIGLTIIAVIWNALTWKLAVVPLLRVILERKWYLLVDHIVPAVFLALGLLIALVAVREMARWLRFRRVTFRLETLPGVIGGRVRGWIESRGALPAGAEAAISISCTRVTSTGSGKSRRTNRQIIWQEKRAAHNASPLADALSIPVDFSIPPGLPQSSMSSIPPFHVWELRVRAGMGRTDLHAEFEIPVFDTGARRERSLAEPPALVEDS
jgi:hypothetical protein